VKRCDTKEEEGSAEDFLQSQLTKEEEGSAEDFLQSQLRLARNTT